MDEMEQAQHELDCLQEIIARHEGHMFSLRGWLLTIVGGFLTAYYTGYTHLGKGEAQCALLAILVLFLVVESRHANLVEAVVERVGVIEKQIAASRLSPPAARSGWYDGPQVSEACRAGASRWWPREGMTFMLNCAFYLVVLLIIVVATVALPEVVVPAVAGS